VTDGRGFTETPKRLNNVFPGGAWEQDNALADGSRLNEKILNPEPRTLNPFL
jgi:hypothetical protein